MIIIRAFHQVKFEKQNSKSFQHSTFFQFVGVICHFLSEIIHCAVIENSDGGLDTFRYINVFLQTYLSCSNSPVIRRMTREKGLEPEHF